MEGLQLKDRIVRFLHKENISSTRFADEIGVQRSSVSHILSGRNKPSFDFIYKILERYTDLNADWLITGKGEMHKSQSLSTGSSTDLSTRESNIFSKPVQSSVKSPSEAVSEDLFNSPAKISLENSQVNSETTPVYEKTISREEKISAPKNPNKQIEKIVVFYTDKTFREYSAE